MSVPNNNIDNALKRLSGQQDSDDFEEELESIKTIFQLDRNDY